MELDWPNKTEGWRRPQGILALDWRSGEEKTRMTKDSMEEN